MFKKLVFLLSFFSFALPQNIQLNEIVSSNQGSYYDEDGDTPDWIELYNSTSNSISLNSLINNGIYGGLSENTPCYVWKGFW